MLTCSHGLNGMAGMLTCCSGNPLSPYPSCLSHNPWFITISSHLGEGTKKCHFFDAVTIISSNVSKAVTVLISSRSLAFLCGLNIFFLFSPGFPCVSTKTLMSGCYLTASTTQVVPYTSLKCIYIARCRSESSTIAYQLVQSTG